VANKGKKRNAHTLFEEIHEGRRELTILRLNRELNMKWLYKK
jgi:hypothetical protein